MARQELVYNTDTGTISLTLTPKQRETSDEFLASAAAGQGVDYELKMFTEDGVCIILKG